MKRASGLALLFSMAACTGLFLGPDPARDRTALFEDVWRNVDRHYSYFALKGIDWDSLHGVYAPQAAAAPTDEALAPVIGAMLAELRDLHVNLYAHGRVYRYTGYDARPTFFNPAVVRGTYVRDLRSAPGRTLFFGHAAPDIGYVWIPAFGGSGFGADLDFALASLGALAGLIIDVRDNGGGSTDNSRDIAGRFADGEHKFAFVQYRNGPGHDDFTARKAQLVTPRGAAHFARPVVVLTNRACVSATEDFVLSMRVLPTVTIVGDSTAGGAGNPLTRELPNGWTYRFSQWIMYTEEGGSHEGIGLPPDRFVRGSAAELAANHDAQLDTALAVVRQT